MFPSIQKKILFSRAFYLTKMKKTVAQLLLILTVLSLASCSMEKRLYSNGYHISWVHPIPKNIEIVASQDVSQDAMQDASQDVAQDAMQDASQDVAQDASQELSQNLPKDLSKNLSSNLPHDLSTNLSKNLDAETLSDTITPNTKQDDYFGQKDYSSTKDKNKKPQDIRELKKVLKDNSIIALFSLVVGALSVLLLSLITADSVDSIKSGIFLIILIAACGVLFLISFPVMIFQFFKLVYLKMLGKPDDYKINQPKSAD
jgi:hypothetical protein